jgi:hypothetical protein
MKENFQTPSSSRGHAAIAKRKSNVKRKNATVKATDMPITAKPATISNVPPKTALGT